MDCGAPARALPIGSSVAAHFARWWMGYSRAVAGEGRPAERVRCIYMVTIAAALPAAVTSFSLKKYRKSRCR